jgi:hypothetical protein
MKTSGKCTKSQELKQCLCQSTFFWSKLKEQNEQTECLKIQRESLAMAKIIRSNEKIAQKIKK